MSAQVQETDVVEIKRKIAFGGGIEGTHLTFAAVLVVVGERLPVGIDMFHEPRGGDARDNNHVGYKKHDIANNC